MHGTHTCEHFGEEVELTLLPSDKQQKGSFYINGYSAELVANLRKDSKKNACFELSAPDRRSFQVGVQYNNNTTDY